MGDVEKKPKKGVKILIIDDERPLLDVMELTLSPAGYDIFAVTGGIEGLEILEKEDIDLIITDFNMPLMNGLEFVKKVREKEKHLTILFCTSAEFTEHYTKNKDLLNIFGVILKPFNRSDLVRAIENAISN